MGNHMFLSPQEAQRAVRQQPRQGPRLPTLVLSVQAGSCCRSAVHAWQVVTGQGWTTAIEGWLCNQL